MFRIKICGITSEADARSAVLAGTDAVGLNFFSKSRRFVEVDAARRIAKAAGDGVLKIGVFVNHSADEIARIAEVVGLDCIQLHGEEPAEFLSDLTSNIPVVRAHRCGQAGLAPLARYLDECQAHGRAPDAVLVDADSADQFGGTGRRADWARIADDRRALRDMPLILAGGLTPANVAAAILAVRPDGVDVASGVESGPGRKDPALVRQFIAAARDTFAGL